MRCVILVALTLVVLPPNHLRQGYGGPPKLYANAEGAGHGVEVLPPKGGSHRIATAQNVRTQAAGDLRLWYRQPAASWNEALPIGNGRLGAMVFGGVDRERLQLNEDTVWAGEKRDRLNPAGPSAVKEVRRLLAEGRAAEAEALADKGIIATPRRMPPYQPLGDLGIAFTHTAPATKYHRQLDLADAIAQVEYVVGDTTFRREVLSSAVDQAIVVRLTRTGRATIGFTARLTRERDAIARSDGSNRIVLEGQAIVDPKSTRHVDERKTGVRFAAALQAVAEGGRVRTDGDALVVENANAVTLVLGAATEIRHADFVAAATRQASAAAGKPFNRLRADHVADYQKLFNRVSLILPPKGGNYRSEEGGGRARTGQRSGGKLSDRATDERLKAVTAGRLTRS